MFISVGGISGIHGICCDIILLVTLPFIGVLFFLFSFGPASNVPKLTHYGVV